MSNQKEVVRPIIGRLLETQTQFKNLNDKIEALLFLLYNTQPPRGEDRTSQEFHDPEMYREAVKLAELFCKKYGNLIPKDEV